MKLLLFISFVLFSFTPALAQIPSGNGKLFGTITDATSGQPVEYATIAIINPETGKPVNGGIADRKGKFMVKNIADGHYDITISFIGFETVKRSVEFTEGNRSIDMSTILLSPSTEILNEVVVEGERALIEERVDRTVYNAENALTSKGGDAADVLRQVPMLSVDLDGNVSIRGSENIRVLINDRPSVIMAGSIADALKQIPADDIKSVEVITSPSAKYDAEGTSGIINIITKKTVLEGATLNINSSAGNRGSNLGLRGGYKQGKLGLSLGGWGRYGYNTLGSFENTQTTGSGTTERITTQQADTRSNYLRANYTLGLDYDFDEKNYITSSARFGARGSKNYQDGLFSETFRNNNPLNSSLRDVISDNRSNSIDLNFNYTHLYSQKQKELSILGLYSIDGGANNFENTIFDVSDFSIDSRLKNINNTTNIEWAVQTDFQTPIGDKQLVEVGGKQTIRRALSDYQYFSAQGTDPYAINSNQQLSNVFNYRQNVTAGYLSYTVNLNKYSFKAGGRYEYTTIDAFFQDELNIKIPSYGVFIPTVNLARKLKNNNMIKAAYNRRIQRPSIRYLNPNIQAPNPLTISVGNPSLDPELTDNFELSYSLYLKGTSLSFAGFSRSTNNGIQQVNDILGDTVRTNYQNIGAEKAYGTSFYANVNIGEKFSLNTGPEIYYTTLSNNVANPIYAANNSGWVVSGRLFGNYNMQKDWSVQFFGFVRGRRVQLQGYRGTFYMYSLALNKDLPNKRGSIGMGVENFLGNSITITDETVTPVINQQSTTIRQNLNFKVTLNLRLGKIDGNSRSSAPRRSRRTISNDDLKDGDGGSQDMGGGEPAQPQTFTGGNRGGSAPAVTPVKTDSSVVVNPTGTWTYTLESPQGGGGTLTINKKGETYSGVIVSSRNNKETPLENVQLQGNGLSFTYETSFGPNTNTVKVVIAVSDETFEGTMSIGQFGNFPMKGKRDKQ